MGMTSAATGVITESLGPNFSDGEDCWRLILSWNRSQL